MAIKMVRQPSETPNINNVDDFIPFRYAYGNQNGYIEDKGNELSYTINGNIFKINSGRAVVQGVEVDIDANGHEIVVDNISSKRYHTIYLEVNLALMTISIKELTDSAGFPFIEESDDLTKNSSGIANLILYGFESYQGVISNIKKNIKKVQYTKDIKVANANNSDTINGMNISKDEKGVATLDGDIVAIKRLIWEGSQTITGTSYYTKIGTFEEIALGDNLVIEGSFSRSGNNHYVKFDVCISNIANASLGDSSEFENPCNVITFGNLQFYIRTMLNTNKELKIGKVVSGAGSSLYDFTLNKIYRIIQ